MSPSFSNARWPVGTPACLPAYGYIDGGTASMVFQLLIAGFLVALFTMRSFWARIKTVSTDLLRRLSQRDD